MSDILEITKNEEKLASVMSKINEIIKQENLPTGLISINLEEKSSLSLQENEESSKSLLNKLQSTGLKCKWTCKNGICGLHCEF